MVLVGEQLDVNGPDGLRKKMSWYTIVNAYEATGHGTVSDFNARGGLGNLFVQAFPGSVSRFFPKNWSTLEEAMLYSMRHYNKIGFTKVDVGTPWLGKSSRNSPIWLGILITPEDFKDTFRGLRALIHEPQHDLGGGFLGTGFGHSGFLGLGGRGAVTPIVQAFDQFVDFAKAAKLANGNSLWTQILIEAK